MVLGAGYMGSGIAQVFSANGHTALLYATSVESAQRHKDKLAASALSLMEKHQPRPITVLPVVDEEGTPLGIVHLTDLLRQGVV